LSFPPKKDLQAAMKQRETITSFLWINAVALAVVAVVVIVGISLLQSATGGVATTAGAALLGSGILGVIGTLVILPLALNLQAARQSQLRQQEDLLNALDERLQNLSVLMNLISEQQLISDRAKSVAFRAKDIEAVRRALREEIIRKDWEAALALANDIEVGFGYKQEADRFRQEITTKRDEVQRQQIAELLSPVDRLIQAEAWGSAVQEAQRIMAQYPDDPQVQRLPEEIENRRQLRKQQLRQSWDEAVSRHDVDGSIEILKRLDVYLTPAEAESMQEIARDVFREKREALRMRFALAVQEHNWAQAIALGDEIMHDFPNTRIAQEVREKMDALRKRADSPEMTTA
jgi:hypothetical protein